MLTSDLRGGAALAGRDHNQELHDGVVNPRAPRLDDEHVLFPDTSHDPHTSFALEGATDEVSYVWATTAVASDNGTRRSTYIGELRELGNARSHSQVLTYLRSERRARCAGEYYRIPHGSGG